MITGEQQHKIMYHAMLIRKIGQDAILNGEQRGWGKESLQEAQDRLELINDTIADFQEFMSVE